jgi:hypothetical protein
VRQPSMGIGGWKVGSHVVGFVAASTSSHLNRCQNLPEALDQCERQFGPTQNLPTLSTKCATSSQYIGPSWSYGPRCPTTQQIEKVLQIYKQPDIAGLHVPPPSWSSYPSSSLYGWSNGQSGHVIGSIFVYNEASGFCTRVKCSSETSRPGGDNAWETSDPKACAGAEPLTASLGDSVDTTCYRCDGPIRSASAHPCAGVDCGHGTCHVQVSDASQYACSCVDAGFTGEHCEHGPCDGVDCGHGTCQVQAGSDATRPSQYVCSCPDGIWGDHCEHDTPDPCASNPCASGAHTAVIHGTRNVKRSVMATKCTADSATHYTCSLCPVGYDCPYGRRQTKCPIGYGDQSDCSKPLTCCFGEYATGMVPLAYPCFSGTCALYTTGGEYSRGRSTVCQSDLSVDENPCTVTETSKTPIYRTNLHSWPECTRVTGKCTPTPCSCTHGTESALVTAASTCLDPGYYGSGSYDSGFNFGFSYAKPEDLQARRTATGPDGQKVQCLCWRCD